MLCNLYFTIKHSSTRMSVRMQNNKLFDFKSILFFIVKLLKFMFGSRQNGRDKQVRGDVKQQRRRGTHAATHGTP